MIFGCITQSFDLNHLKSRFPCPELVNRYGRTRRLAVAESSYEVSRRSESHFGAGLQAIGSLLNIQLYEHIHIHFWLPNKTCVKRFHDIVSGERRVFRSLSYLDYCRQG